jgi:hypothetical protein
MAREYLWCAGIFKSTRVVIKTPSRGRGSSNHYKEGRGVQMKSFRVLVCGGDGRTLQKVAQKLSDEGVQVATSTRIIDQMCRPDQEWDLLLVDLDALTSFLRGMLPAIRLQFPDLNILGMSEGPSPDIGFLSYDLELDGYMLGSPKPEDLIVRLPRLAANYLCEPNTFNAISN